MPRIFISYRRDDSRAIAGRIYDRLIDAFGEENIFKDVDRIPPGSTFAEVLESELAKCNVLLIIIGRLWVNITDKAGQRRLENPEDFVRIEVEKGLNREGLLVIPVLVDEAAVPNPADLPDSLDKIASLQVVQVRHDPDFHRDMNRLIDFLKILQHQEASVQSREQANARRNMRRTLTGVGVLAALLVFGLLALLASGAIKIGGTAEATFDPAGTAFAQLSQTDVAQVAAVAMTDAQASVEAILTQFVTETQIAGTLTAKSYTDTPTFTYTPSDTPTASSTPTETPTQTLSATPTARANETATAQAQLTQEARDAQRTQTALNIQATNDALATRNAPTNTPEPSNTPTPTESQTPSVTPTRTPTPTTAPTATPTATLTPTRNVAATQTADAAQLATAEQNARATQAAARTEAPGDNLVLEVSNYFEGACGPISPDGSLIAIVGDGVYEIASGQRRFAINGIDSENVRFSPDSRWLVVNRDGVYDASNWQKRFAIASFSRSFSPDSRWLVVGDGIYEVATGQRRLVFATNASVDFNPDGSLVAIGGDGVYEVATGQKRFAVEGEIPLFSPDGSLVSVSGDGVYEVATGQKRFVIEGDYVSFSPDSSLVAVGQHGVYEVARWQQRFVIEGDYVSFSPDGNLLMTDRGIYNAENGEQVTPLRINLHPSLGLATLDLDVDGCYLLAPGARVAGAPEGFLVSNSDANFNLRQQPSSGATVLAPYSTLPFFSLSQEADWYQVEYAPGRFGWVSASVVDVVMLPIDLSTSTGLG